jgi:AcrR family transcriptional regulator
MKTMQTEPAPRRQLERGGYARGEQTRSRIVATALRIFGEHGYDQPSTRRIAAEAGVNPPALQYYFGGKEGLHRACAQFIIDRVLASLAPAYESASQALASRSRTAARAALCEIVDSLSESLTNADSDNWSRFVARGKADGAGPAMSMIRARIGLPLIDTTARLISILYGTAAVTPATRLRAMILLAPINWILANRGGVLSILGWNNFDEDHLTLLKQSLRVQVAALGAPGPPARHIRMTPRARRRFRNSG